MPNDPIDIRTVWQNQTKEPSNMSLDLIRYKAQQIESVMHRQVVGVYVVVLGIVAVCLFIFWRADQIPIRMGAAVLVLWALGVAYQARKGVWPGRLARDATLKASVDFYRQALERERFRARMARKTLWPVLLCAALFVMSTTEGKPELLVKMLPFLGMMAAWAVGLVVLARRKLRTVQRELDELASL